MPLMNKTSLIDFCKNYSLVFNKATFYDYKLVKYLLEKNEITGFSCLFETKQSNKGDGRQEHHSKLIVKLKSISDLAIVSSMLIIESANDQTENSAYFFCKN